MAEKLVSIIIPAFKAEKYIAEALESIAKQNYCNWELLVIEDGCKDKTEEIVQAFSNNHRNHHIKFIRHQQNKGLGATRNTGIGESQGEYLAFLDHDDIWKPNHLFEAVNALTYENGDIAYSTTQMFQDSDNQYLGLWGPTDEDIENFSISLYRRSFLTPSAVVFNKSVVDKVGLFDTNPKIHYSEDHDYWIRAARLNLKFVHLKNITCLYRKNHPGSATLNAKMILERELYVYEKHSDWDIISEEMKKDVMSNCYVNLAIYTLEENQLRALSLFCKSQTLYSFNYQQAWKFFRQIIRLFVNHFF
jgi:glycosyltransferase involved in cell wall biosynthesis